MLNPVEVNEVFEFGTSSNYFPYFPKKLHLIITTKKPQVIA
jgi:hypothetical protein